MTHHAVTNKSVVDNGAATSGKSQAAAGRKANNMTKNAKPMTKQKQIPYHHAEGWQQRWLFDRTCVALITLPNAARREETMAPAAPKTSPKTIRRMKNNQS